jgi:hypothetical protein
MKEGGRRKEDRGGGEDLDREEKRQRRHKDGEIVSE